MELHKNDLETGIEISDGNGNSVKTTAKKLQDVSRQLRMDGEGFAPIRTNFEQSRLDEKFRSAKKMIVKSPDVTKMAETVIESQGLDIGPASVGCLLIYPNISKQRAAKVTKQNEVQQYLTGFDYLVQISGDLWDMLDTDTQKMVLYHQLMQIDPVFKAKNQEWQFKLRKPDFSDFYQINDKHGNNWYKVVQATVSSLYDLDPRMESQVKL